jgi:hypothetical protein
VLICCNILPHYEQALPHFTIKKTQAQEVKSHCWNKAIQVAWAQLRTPTLTPDRVSPSVPEAQHTVPVSFPVFQSLSIKKCFSVYAWRRDLTENRERGLQEF